MSNLTPHQKSAIDFSDHLSLTANAGSGKTFVLARKYLNAALQPGISLKNIAAITFTDKAAGELYNKIADLIELRITESKSETEIYQLTNLRRNLISANISTIHSFCLDILREYPVEADLDARFTPIDSKLSGELIELAVEESIKELIEAEGYSEDVKYLVRILGSRSLLESEIASMINHRKNIQHVRENIYSKSDDNILIYFEEQFEEYFKNIWNDFSDKLTNSVNKINEIVLQEKPDNQFAVEIKFLIKNLKKSKSSKEIIQTLAQLKDQLLTASNIVKTRGYLAVKNRDELIDDISIVEQILKELSKIQFDENHDELNKELVKFGKILLRIYDVCSNKYSQFKGEEGFLDFEDILILTKNILANENVRINLTSKYKFIMVDEFQDTNEIQYDIFLPILDYLKDGNLFIVGDEKQSIYKFRDAELEIFNRTKNDIEQSSGTNSIKVLPDSFRMAPLICLFSNTLFKTLFKNPNPLYNEVSHSDIICARNDEEEGTIEFLISREDEESASEAELVSKKIIELVNSGSKFSDIAVLVRKRKSFSELERQFIIKGIPFSIIGGRGFYQKQSISDIFNYLSFLADPGNSIALLGLLRSPFFSISDSTLFEIAQIKKENFWNKFLESANSNSDLTKIAELLKENINLSSSLAFSLLIRKILTDTNYLTIISARVDGKQELANINKLISISRSFSLKGFQNLYDFIKFLKESIDSLTDESQAFVASDSDAVQLMTIHQAKGLEFPTVFLFNSHESSLKTIVKSKQIIVDKKFGLLTKLPIRNEFLSEYRTTLLNGVFNFVEEKKRIAELKRLFYVAVTRAKNHLIISGKVDDQDKLSSDSFLYFIKSGLNINLLKDSLLVGELNHLRQDRDNYLTVTKKYSVNIPTKFNIDEQELKLNNIKTETVEKIINLDTIPSPSSKEIISATKIAVFNQCPTKYLLTYEYGYGELNRLQEKYSHVKSGKSQFYGKPKEELGEEPDGLNINFSGELRGTIIHSILENITTDTDIKALILEKIKKFGVDDNSGKLIESIERDLELFLKSKLLQQILAHNNFKNEFEVYLREGNLFLFGILDKIIFESDQITIVDYKTDNIDVSEINERAENYLIQLKFYLYIVQKLFSNYTKFRIILIFIKHPDNPVINNFNKANFPSVRGQISDIITNIIEEKYDKNLSHCFACPYSKNNFCILSS